MIARRTFLKQGFLLAALAKTADVLAKVPLNKFKIGACDWSIGKSSNIGSFGLAREIGLDGLMVNMGSKEDDLHLRKRNVQDQFLAESARTGVAISSIAIGELNNYPYKSDPQTEQWVYDSVLAAEHLKVPVILLAFFNKNDLRNDEKGIRETIARLKRVAPEAEKRNVILGIESYLNADDHIRIIDKVGSPNVKVYMDFRNTADAGHDVIKDVIQLGKDRICELHMKENGALLGKGTLPWRQIRETLDQINYFGDGWMQIESSNPSGGNIVDNYKHNLQFLRQLFTVNA